MALQASKGALVSSQVWAESGIAAATRPPAIKLIIIFGFRINVLARVKQFHPAIKENEISTPKAQKNLKNL